ncbi:GNAT family N-acetyltransferase [Rhodanobacter sp. Si-c]|uniref:GNAT family N-acetyltransferase n=1 Tax=Rhodanobacter lycopersici TaxID=3162487 RepID=A0ABV3QCU6_9GAMM
MTTGLQWRRARPDDADVAVPLLVEALAALALELAGAGTAREVWPVFRVLFAARGHRYSHEHMRVLDEDGAAVAVILAYPGRDEPALAAASLARLRERDPSRALRHETKSAPDEYYLDALAVAPSQRGRGLAARMIEAVCAEALAAGHTRAGLLVDEAKPGVKRLYRKLGFAVDGERMLSGHRHDHMVKPLR